MTPWEIFVWTAALAGSVTMAALAIAVVANVIKGLNTTKGDDNASDV